VILIHTPKPGDLAAHVRGAKVTESNRIDEPCQHQRWKDSDFPPRTNIHRRQFCLTGNHLKKGFVNGPEREIANRPQAF